MREVTIEGTEIPAAGVLARGRRATVAYTTRIARLISFGYIRIVSGPTPVDEDESPESAPEVVQTEPAGDQAEQAAVDDSAGETSEVVQSEIDKPAKAPRTRGTRT